MSAESQSAPPPTERVKRFGAFAGVFTPSILTILGVILYLRMGWVVGSVGLAQTLAIILMAHVISITTALSVSSIATNRTVGAGGAYYMISRSLGGPAGAAIGLPLFFAQALSIAFYVVGFVESLSLLLGELDTRLVGIGVAIVLAVISLRGAELVIRTQYLVMGAIVLSLVSLFLGVNVSQGGSSTWAPPAEGPSFAVVFAVFFPAVTGLMAGVSMSGDLREPRRDIPVGTIGAVLVGMIIYPLAAIWLAAHADLETLAREPMIMWNIARVPALVFAGVWAASLSSALGSVLAAPRTLQALATDGFLPRFLARGHGPAAEPMIGLAFSFVLALIAIVAGGFDRIAQILTMFFLAAYGVMNLACGLERWAASPSFRPAFRVPWWLSLLGAIACFYVMSLISVPSMIIALLVCAGIYALAQRRSLGNTFGDARHGIWAGLVRTSLQHYRRARFHPVNWRPNLLIFGGSLSRRSYLAELGSTLVQDRGIVSFSQLIEGEVEASAATRKEALEFLEAQVRRDFPNLFCRVDVVENLHRGMVGVAQSYGVGNFEANTVLFGWTAKDKRQEGLLEAIRDILALDRSVLIADYDEDRGFGLRRKIDVWWGGLERNGALMLLLAFLLTSHERWQDARVRLLTIVATPEQEERARIELRRILSHTHLAADARVLMRGDSSIPEIMAEFSGQSDLVLVGLRRPTRGESSDDFFQPYEALLARLPTTLMVASAPSFEGAPVLFDDEIDATTLPTLPGTSSLDRAELQREES